MATGDVKCNRTKEPCFARSNGMCTILTEAPKNGKRCSFRKSDRAWTDGKYYPYYPPDKYGKGMLSGV